MTTDRIPAELRERPQWVVWKHVQRNGTPTKVPFQVNGREAKSNSPSTWSTFEEAAARFNSGGFEGVGYMFSESDPYVGIDLDGCRDPETGRTRTWAVEWMQKLGSYAEISPSMTGWKIVCIGENPRGKGGNKKLEGAPMGGKNPGVEIYSKSRFFALTGLCHDDYTSLREANGTLREFVETYWPPRKKRGPTAASGDTSSGDVIERARRYVAKMAGAVSGQNGHDQTFTVACRLVIGFDLTPHQAYPILAEYNQRCEPPWSEGELRHKLESADEQDGPRGELRDSSRPSEANRPAGGAATKDSEPVIANCRRIQSDEGKELTVPQTMADIIATANTVTGNWPRRVADALFVASGDDVHWLKTEAALFSYYHERAGVHWTKGARFVTKGELYAALQRTATNYDAVETLPHEPRLPRHYYVCGDTEPGDGEHLRQLVNRFAPATPIDGDLMLAAICTPGWGGPPGSRPAFVITSDHGRGMGKSKFAELVGMLWNGTLTFSHHEDIQKIKTRMLTPDAMTKRIALLDNLKSLRFSWAELEAMVTCDTIGGHRMYVGEGTRPNVLTWLITLNGGSMSTDMAQRSVVIKLDKPTWSGTWFDDTKAFITKNQNAIIRDVVGFLRSEPMTLEKYSRWGNWERDVLARLPEPSEAQAVILERQGASDVEAEEAETIEDYFRGKLKWLGYDASEWVFIPSRIANWWYNRAQNDKMTTTQSTRVMNQMATEGRLKRLRWHRMDQGRGFLWNGDGCGNMICTDLGERLANHQE